MRTEPRTKAERRKFGLYFLIALVLMIVLLIVEPQFFWVPLPFVLTYAVLATDTM